MSEPTTEPVVDVKAAPASDPPVKAKDLEPLKSDPAPQVPKDDTPQTANKLDVPQTAGQPSRAVKDEKPQSLYQKLAAIHHRVEAAAHSRVTDGKAEEFADCWAELDAIGEGDPSRPHEVAMIQAAHNHLQHHAPRRASEIDSLNAQLDEAVKAQARPEAKPDTPELAHVKDRIAALQTHMANDPKALPGDKEKAQALQHKVDGLTAEKATK